MLMDDSELQYRERRYERRIVTFFDILGWRDHILEAGNDPRRIGRLAAASLTFSEVVVRMAERAEGAYLTSFSDTVVVSVPYDSEKLPWSLEGLATIQLALSFMGFWIRGATTVGDLIHDSNLVFGPALNRAYELESRSAIYPRTIIDPTIPELMSVQADFIDFDDKFRFTDPFKLNFIERIQNTVSPAPEMIESFNRITGARVPTKPMRFDAHSLLQTVFQRLRAELLTSTKPDDRQKIAWLFDRIAERLRSVERSSDL